MRLMVIGSSSRGNGYVLQANNGEAIVMECGMPLRLVKKAVGYNVSCVRGVIVTHEHGDHAGRCKEYLDELFAPMYMSAGTWGAIMDNCNARREPTIVRHMDKIVAGSFKLTPLLLKSANGNLTHDAKEPMCWMVEHDEVGRMLFLTDSYCCPYSIKGLNNIMIECNYDMDILGERYEAGLVDTKRMRRTIESHMSVETCKKELASMDLKDVMNIVLIHMSADNGHRERFVDEVVRCTGKRVFCANMGEIIELNKNPF